MKNADITSKIAVEGCRTSLHPHRRSLRSTLRFLKESKAKRHDRSTNKQRQNGVCSDDVPHNANTGSKSSTSLRKQTGNSHSGLLRSFLLPQKGGLIPMRAYALVAGAGFEPTSPNAEFDVLPLHQPAIL